MNFKQIIALSLLFSLVLPISEYCTAKVDPINNIEFIQTGKLLTDNKEYTISNEMNIREFLDGKIVRITGYTVEGYPYITYSKITNQEITTHGKIFTDNKFSSLVFEQKNISKIEKIETKKSDNISILTQYTERVYSGQTAKIDIKIFDPYQNNLNDYNLNYGFISNTNIHIKILEKDGNVFLSLNGVTNEKGFFSTKFFIPKDSQSNSFTVVINAENDNFKTSKTIQIFNLGEVPDHDKSP